MATEVTGAVGAGLDHSTRTTEAWKEGGEGAEQWNGRAAWEDKEDKDDG
jgi:hypothetical protein